MKTISSTVKAKIRKQKDGPVVAEKTITYEAKQFEASDWEAHSETILAMANRMYKIRQDDAKRMELYKRHGDYRGASSRKPASVIAWENVKDPTPENYMAFCTLLGLDPDEFRERLSLWKVSGPKA